MGDMIVIVLLGLCIVLAIRSMYKANKQGGCCGNCSKCKNCQH